MEYRILGPLDVRAGGRPVDLGRPKQRAVLAVLLLSANRVVSVDRLIELLWGDDVPSRATGALQAYVSNLRRVLEPARAARAPASVLVTQPPGYVLRVGTNELDSARFEMLAERGHRQLVVGRPRAARDELRDALALWRGPALAEFAFEAFAQTEAARLEELRAVVVEDQLEAELALGNHAQVVGELEAAVGERPLRERLWGLLVLALYRSGRQGEALRAYARARLVLGEELGIEPSPALRRLEADVLAQSTALDWRPPAGDPEEPSGPDVGSRPAACPPTAATASPADMSAARLDDLAHERPPLVGREGAMRVLETSLDAARAGRGRLVLVSGEPGIGKTRLVEELAACAGRAGAAVAWGRAHEGEGAPPFWPWVQVISDLLSVGRPGQLGEALTPVAGQIAQIVPEVKELVAKVAPPSPLDPASARFRLYEAVTAFLLKLSVFRPVVVILDDLQWADLPSLELIEFLAGRIAPGHLVVACTYRDVDPAPDGALTATLASLARRPVVDRLELRGLDEASVGVFMSLMTGADFTPEVSADVWARTNGNPFFVGELARLIAAEPEHPNAGVRPAQVPVAVRDVIRQRLARLPARTNTLLTVAATAGPDFDLRVATAAAGIPADEALEAVDAALRSGVLEEDPVAVGRYRFSHVLVQETIYRQVPGLRRAQLHAGVAEALAALPETEVRVAELAHHTYLAVPVRGPEDAFRYALRAAEIAQARLAYEQAERHLHRALELAETMPPGARAHHELESLNRLAALLSLTKGYHVREVTDIWSRARELCDELGTGPEVLATLWGLARAARARGQLGLSYELGTQLLQLADDSPGDGFTVAGRECCGIAAMYKGDLAEAADHLGRLGVPGDHRTPESTIGLRGPTTAAGTLVMHPQVLGRSYLAVTRWLQGADDEATALDASSIASARTTGQAIDEAVALTLSAQLALLRYDSRSVSTLAGEIIRIAEACGARFLAIMARAAAAWGHAHGGHPHAGLDGCAQALLELEATGWHINWTYFLGLLADTFRLAGRHDAALVTIQESLTEVRATGERYYEAELHRQRGEILAAQGADWGPIEAALTSAREVAAAQGAVPFLRRAEHALLRLRPQNRPRPRG